MRRILPSSKPLNVKAGHSETAVITLTNEGNVAAKGTVNLDLHGSTDQTLDISDSVLAALTGRKISLAPGHSLTLRVTFVMPSNAVAGAYFLFASTTSSTQPADINASNDVAMISTV